MPLTHIRRKLPSKAQLAAMSPAKRAASELEMAKELGIRRKGGMRTGGNGRSTRITSLEPALGGLKRPGDAVMRVNDDDVQPDSLNVRDKPFIPDHLRLTSSVLEKRILVHAEGMDERMLAEVGAQVLPQMNALAAMGRKGRRIKTLQTRMSKMVFGDKALAAMKRKKKGGMAG